MRGILRWMLTERYKDQVCQIDKCQLHEHGVNDGFSGIGVIEATQKRGERWGTYAAILRDLEKRPNVKISRYSEAIKVMSKKRKISLECEL